MLLQGRTGRSFPPEEEEAAETTWIGLGLTANPTPCPAELLGGVTVGLGPGRREEWEEGIFKTQLHLSLSYSDSFGELFWQWFCLN